MSYILPKNDYKDGEILYGIDLNASNDTIKAGVDDNFDRIQQLDADKVDKIEGKGLSTEDYTTEEKTKLSGIAAGAEVNVQPDWDQLDTTADDYIKNKPTTIAGYGITDAYTKTQTDTELAKKVDKVTGKQLSTEDYTTEEKTKLSSIESGAEVNTIETVKVNNSALTPDSNKAINISVPTQLSELTDDSTHRLVTDTEKETWDAKADTSDIPDVSDFITKDVNNLTYYTLATDTGHSIELSINSSTYVMTLNLKNSAGTTISTGSVDLPLESVVVSGSYDSANKKVVLTLQNGSTIEFSVADLVSGLQTEITSSNKLSSDLVDDTNKTHLFVSSSEKTTWNNKVGTTNYATDSVGGVIKSDWASGTYIAGNGKIKSRNADYTTYNSYEDTSFISKGTLENVITGKGIPTNTNYPINYVTEAKTKITDVATKEINVIGVDMLIDCIVDGEPMDHELLKGDIIIGKASDLIAGNIMSINHFSSEFFFTTMISQIDNNGNIVLTSNDLYVNVHKNDYAGEEVAGVIKAYSNYGTSTDNGRLRGVTKTYAQYQSANNLMLISKVTLENVITGKGIPTSANYPINYITEEKTKINDIATNNINVLNLETELTYIDLETEESTTLLLPKNTVLLGKALDTFLEDIPVLILFPDGRVYTITAVALNGNMHYENYTGSYATKSYVDGLVGDINTALDTLNGEVI